MTRAGRNPLTLKEAKRYASLFASLFKSAGVIYGLENGAFFDENKADGLTSAYILSTLYERGKIAYDKQTGAWLPYTSAGAQTLYGRARSLTLFGANGANITRERGEVVEFFANPDAVPLRPTIEARSCTLAEFDQAIRQNLDAIKEMSILYTDNPATENALRNADNKRRDGASVVILGRGSEDYGELGKLSTGAEYKIDKLLKDRRKLYEETLHLVGVRTPIEKGERMISDEVNTQNAETDAYLGVLVRSFNETARLNGLPFVLEVDAAAVDVVGEEV